MSNFYLYTLFNHSAGQPLALIISNNSRTCTRTQEGTYDFPRV